MYIRKKEEKVRRQEILKLYSKFINKGDLCFDIGANIGTRIDAFIALGAISVAVEPQPSCVKHLQAKYKKNRRVTICPKAVGDKEGGAQLMLCRENGSMSTLSKEWLEAERPSGRLANYHWDKSITVPVTTLGKLLEQYGIPVFCKIDVEGYEFNVLNGLFVPIETISFEYHPSIIGEAINCVKHLSSIGTYYFNYTICESMCLTLEKWVTPDQMCGILESLPLRPGYGDVYATTSPELFTPSNPKSKLTSLFYLIRINSKSRQASSL